MKFRFYMVIILLFAFQSSCKEERSCNDGLYSQWEVKEFFSVESRTYQRDNNYFPILTFKENGEVEAALDINHCSGQFTADASGNMTITMMACTEACCDSEFSVKLIDTLPLVTGYVLETDRLRLIVEGWGEIVLEPL